MQQTVDEGIATRGWRAGLVLGAAAATTGLLAGLVRTLLLTGALVCLLRARPAR
jgi:hypothetical protein